MISPSPAAPPEAELARRARRLKLVLTDCDGVLTDAGVYYSAEGEALKRFSVRDGMGVARLSERGIATAIVTQETSAIVRARADKLGIVAHLGVADKAAALDAIVERAGLAIDDVAYIGDDVNDLGVVRRVAERGLTAAPADAVPEILAVAHFRAPSAGGHGAFRDFAEWLIGLRSPRA